ncbi:MAG: hypothetical protein IPO78_10425 [Saprospiraceae bacterium]|nr:hypothetical protein [Saprospiraceae bacterium]
MYQLIDYLNPEGNIAITQELNKIDFNLSRIVELNQNIEFAKAISNISTSAVTALGRWIIVYHSNVIDNKNTAMYFLNIDLDANLFEDNKVFPSNIIDRIRKIQQKYSLIDITKIDSVELTFAELHEIVLKPNLFSCKEDSIVLKTAERLGAFPIIENLKEGDRVKVTLVDERIMVDEKEVIHVYAFVHFGGHSEEYEHENGFIYIKLFDLHRNPERIEDFLVLVEGTSGGNFDRVLFFEKFSKERLN